MPSPPKCFIHGAAIEICSSIQTGLPLVASLYMAVVLKGVLAAAQEKYPVTVCAFVILGNHIHLLCIVEDPKCVSDFMRYFKGESAHAVNRFLGRTGINLWKKGYDSPRILNPHHFLKRLLYLYMNPVEAGLAGSIESYAGVSSYKALRLGAYTEECRKISRDSIPELPQRPLSLSEQRRFTNLLNNSKGWNCTLRVDPWAWLQAFPASQEWNVAEVKERFISLLKSEEERLAKDRKTPVPDSNSLRCADPRRSYTSKRAGKKMICLSDDVEERKNYIIWFYKMWALAKEAYELWKRGAALRPPPGFFAPGGALLANILPSSVGY